MGTVLFNKKKDARPAVLKYSNDIGSRGKDADKLSQLTEVLGFLRTILPTRGAGVVRRPKGISVRIRRRASIFLSVDNIEHGVPARPLKSCPMMLCAGS